MLKGVLFDLDGTLLDIDLADFLERYFGALGPVCASVTADHIDVKSGLDAVLASTNAMMRPHPGQLNRDVFNASFLELTGADLALAENAAVFDRFYAETFPALRGPIGPRDGGTDAVGRAIDLGLRVAVATNPIFPRAAIDERMRWAGVGDLGIEVVTSYENMRACKPNPEYFAQTAEMLGVDPRECLMVGDDRSLDMAAADIGMRTFYVGDGARPQSDYAGDLFDVRDLLGRLTS